MSNLDARRAVILTVASRHRVSGLRWWAPPGTPAWLDLVVERAPRGLAAFCSDLESALGCRVAVYVAGQIPHEAWGRVLSETVAL